ncbi:hypothetical protein ABEB36_004725 [Hypothenemus hampei]|uniref:Regulatory protein zeste n=1 Tax=Hypothenemus hampei TaxID=57062 RepID=A0ABD1F5T2_HYPHA
MSQRNARMTKNQKDIFITYLEQSKELVAPKQSLSNLPDIELKWQALANLLNDEKGAKKTVKQWKEAWNELKTNTKRKAREIKFDFTGTGGGSKKVKDLTQQEERVMSLLSNIVVEGIPLLPETGVCEENLEENNNNSGPSKEVEFEIITSNKENLEVINVYERDKIKIIKYLVCF